MPSKWLSRAKNDRNNLVVLQQPPVLGQEHQASGGQEFKTALYTHTAYLIIQPTGHRSTTDMHHIPQKPSYVLIRLGTVVLYTCGLLRFCTVRAHIATLDVHIMPGTHCAFLLSLLASVHPARVDE